MPGPAFKISAVITAVDKITRPLRSITRAVTGRLGGALSGVASMAGRATSAIRGMLGPLGLLSGGAVVAGLGAMVKKHAMAADELGKFSRQVGLGVEELQKYEFAADHAGVRRPRRSSCSRSSS